MQIARLPDIDDNTWAEVKAYVEGPPHNAFSSCLEQHGMGPAIDHSAAALSALLLAQAIRRPQRPCRASPKTRKPCEAPISRVAPTLLRHATVLLQQFLIVSTSLQAGCRLRPSPSSSVCLVDQILQVFSVAMDVDLYELRSSSKP